MRSIVADLYYIILLNVLTLFNSQKLNRTPEPEGVTTNIDAVNDYDNVLNSSLVLLYALNIEILSRLQRNKNNISILDLACGPSIFGLLCSEHFAARKYTGVDLSQPMLEKAKMRFKQSNFKGESVFSNSSMTDLSKLETVNGKTDSFYDLITITDCAHHLDTVKDFSKVIVESEKKVSKEGIIFISDVVRPKTYFIFKHYYKWISKKNELLKLNAHNLDFKNSIQAAFTVEELTSAIPHTTNHSWYQIAPKGFKYTQIIIGLPKAMELNLSQRSIKKLDFIPAHLKNLWDIIFFQFRLFSKTNLIHK
jgi:ubiquinone/menaquinone biosynthesis C-methylase UbiE